MPDRRANRGVIAVDGPLASGKTPFCRALTAELRRAHGPAALTEALSSTELGSFVRKAQFLYMGRPLALIAAADRQLQIDTVIAPAISRREFVVIDRYVLTAVALDGFGAGQDAEMVMRLYDVAPQPEISYLVISPLEYRASRLREKGLLAKYDDWFMRMEHEESCYRQAAELLKRRGWCIELLEQPLVTMDSADYARIARDIATGASRIDSCGSP